MPEFWLDVWPVGYDGPIYITGRVPGFEKFEAKLTDDQKNMYEAFMHVQRQKEQEFLMGLVL